MARNLRRRIREWWRRNSFGVVLTALGFISLVAYLSPAIFISIHPGEVGVQWSRFRGGTITDKVYGEGLHAIAPWNIMYKYNVRFQRNEAHYDVLSSDGLRMETVFTVRFRPITDRVALLHQRVGPDYVKTLLVPEMGAIAREKIAQYEPEEFYSQKRLILSLEILEELRQGTRVGEDAESSTLSSTRFLHIEDVFIESISLPEDVAEAIRGKLSQEQHLEEYDYIVAREEKEKERKRIEAEGIRLFQDIVAEGISDRYLRWKGIDATLSLALSPNSKVVVIGAGEGGLPIILGNIDGGGARAALSSEALDSGQLREPRVPSGPELPPD